MRFNVLLGTALAGIAAAVICGCYCMCDVSSCSADDSYEEVAQFINRDAWDGLRPVQQDILVGLAQQKREFGRPLAAACWESDPNDPDAMQAFNNIISNGFTDPLSPLFQLTTRWTSTAYSGGGLGQGDPTTISVSFPADGLTIPNGVGEPAAPNTFFADFIPRYGNAAAVTNIVMQQLQQIGSFTGIDYVFEPTDDGAAFFTSPGVQGVRGDVRIGGKSIDGNSGILAYNFFPQNGDMVFDSPDNFYDNTANNSQRFRNTISHEHGHGTGLLHVCPANQTKLMEPFISTAYTGPQHDDTRAWQRHYGDVNEHNDTVGTATALGVLGDGTISLDDLSIDDNADVDYFEFSVVGSKEISITLAPDGFTYDSGPQSGNCNTGSSISSLTVQDLAVDVIDSNGTTILGTAAIAGLGQTENLIALPLPGSGPFFVRVRSTNAANDVQLYDMDLTIAPFAPPAFTITFPMGLPTQVNPDIGAIVDVQVVNGTGSPDPANAFVFARVDGGAFTSSLMANQGGGLFSAVLPAAACFSTIDFYFDIGAMGGGNVESPVGAPLAFHTADVLSAMLTTLISDDFETDQGWSVTDSPGLVDGTWDRGVPAGGGDRGDPAADFDGSGQCYLTDNVDGNSDVDGGTTTLTSPSIDLSSFTQAQLSYAFWYDNDFGGAPNQDIFVIEISRDGSTWINVENYNANVDAWVEREILLTDYVQPSNNVQMRFAASDLGTGSVVEAGLDAFECIACPPSSGLGPCAAGTLGVDTLLIDGSNGGPDRRVIVGLNNAFTLDILDPPASTNSPHAIILKLGLPAPGDIFPISPIIGDLCFPPRGAQPNNPLLFTLANSFGPDPAALVPTTNTPWSIVIGPIPFILEITFQAAQLNGALLRVSNAVVAAIGF